MNTVLFMKIATMRQERKQNIRSNILRTAREMFVHDGYAGFSMRALAGQLGCAPSATYKHFKNKNEIFDCLMEESFSGHGQCQAARSTLAVGVT